jgi:hypothetical protein
MITSCRRKNHFEENRKKSFFLTFYLIFILVHPCDKAVSPCGNGAKCIKKDDDEFVCNCTENWTGEKCETIGTYSQEWVVAK